MNLCGFDVGLDRPLFLIAGPDTLESEQLCLDVAGANPAPGTPVQMYTCNGTNAQRWALGDDDTIRSLVSSSVTRCLEVNRSETDTSTAFPTTPIRRKSST